MKIKNQTAEKILNIRYTKLPQKNTAPNIFILFMWRAFLMSHCQY